MSVVPWVRLLVWMTVHPLSLFSHMAGLAAVSVGTGIGGKNSTISDDRIGTMRIENWSGNAHPSVAELINPIA